jgi:hypothetical protein
MRPLESCEQPVWSSARRCRVCLPSSVCEQRILRFSCSRCPGVWLGRSDRWADDSYNAISPLSPPALSIPLLHGKPQTCPGQLSPLRWLAFYVLTRFVLVQEFAAAGAEVTGDESHWRLITAEHHTAVQVPKSRLRHTEPEP